MALFSRNTRPSAAGQASSLWWYIGIHIIIWREGRWLLSTSQILNFHPTKIASPSPICFTRDWLLPTYRQPTRKRTDVLLYSDVRAYGHLIISPSLSPCLFIQQTELMGNTYIRIPTCVWYSILYDYHSVKRKYRIIYTAGIINDHYYSSGLLHV